MLDHGVTERVVAGVGLERGRHCVADILLVPGAPERFAITAIEIAQSLAHDRVSPTQPVAFCAAVLLLVNAT